MAEVSMKRYRYIGKERDEGTGFYYIGARYYVSWLCRWTAVDPLEAELTPESPYCYAHNNPINWSDPDGMKPDIDPKHTGDINKNNPDANAKTPLKAKQPELPQQHAARDNTGHAPIPNLRDVKPREMKLPESPVMNATGKTQMTPAQKARHENKRAEMLRDAGYKQDGISKTILKKASESKTAEGLQNNIAIPMIEMALVANGTSAILNSVKVPLSEIAIKSALDVSLQAFSNKGDVSKIDFFDAALAGVANPTASWTLGSAVDYKPLVNMDLTDISIVGGKKDESSVILDLAFKGIFGGVGIGGEVKNALSPSLKGVSPDLKFTFNTLMSVPTNATGKILRTEVKEKTGR